MSGLRLTPARVVGLLLGVALGGLLGGLIVRGCPRDWGPACTVRGRTLGPAREVVAVQSAEGFLRPATFEAGSGRFEVAVPRAVPVPWLVIHGPEGARVESGPLRDLSGEVLEVPALAVWTTPLRLRREGQRLRFDWSPLPTGEGFPEARRYSLLLDYPRDPTIPDQRGEMPERGQTALLSFDPWLELPVGELLGDMPDVLSPEAEVELELRAYDPARTEGALWVGARARWRMGGTELRPAE